MPEIVGTIPGPVVDWKSHTVPVTLTPTESTDSPSENYTVLNSALFASALPKYHCPKHGNVGDTVMHVSILDEPKSFRHYCIRCFDELLRANVSQVTEVTDDA